jgi:hypothetical protein
VPFVPHIVTCVKPPLHVLLHLDDPVHLVGMISPARISVANI